MWSWNDLDPGRGIHAPDTVTMGHAAEVDLTGMQIAVTVYGPQGQAATTHWVVVPAATVTLAH